MESNTPVFRADTEEWAEKIYELEEAIRRDVRAIGSIYANIGAAFFQEAEDRLVQRVARTALRLIGGEANGQYASNR